MKRSNAEAISCDKKLTFFAVPDRHRKLPVKFFKALGPVFFIKMQDHFGVARRIEAVPFFYKASGYRTSFVCGSVFICLSVSFSTTLISLGLSTRLVSVPEI